MTETLIEKTFITLRKSGLVTSAEQFSEQWCRRSKSYFAERRHTGHDFSIQTAMACIDKARMAKFFLRNNRKKTQELVQDEMRLLDEVEDKLLAFLEARNEITYVEFRRSAQLRAKYDAR